MNQQEKYKKRRRRHMRVRNRVRGTQERPRLVVFRSLTNIYAQIVNDDESRTLCAVSSLSPKLREESKLSYGGNIKAAKVVGTHLAQMATQKGIKQVVFDRGHARFHGRIKALADAARKGGLAF